MATIDTTTSTTTTTSTQTNSRLTVTSQANTQYVGTYVTDVSIAPYINPTIISFYAYNLRPNQLMHVFFDSVLVDQFCAPGIVPSPTANLDTSTYTSIPINGAWGAPIYTDSNGRVAGQFAVPGATFKTGDRMLEIADVTSLTLGANAISTLASAYFTASNLNVTKQAVTLTTVNPQIYTVPSVTTVVNTTTVTSSTVLPDTPVTPTPPTPFVPVYPPLTFNPEQFDFSSEYGGGDPLAQTLSIKTPTNQSGIFATSIDLFFAKVSQVANNGVTVYICQIDNGYPNGQAIIPFSKTHLPLANINVSNTANVATTFKFEAPVFLNNGVNYAFVVKPDASDPDYAVYTANIGDIDITTGFQVFSQPILGTAFFGATGSAWTALQTEYVKFTLRRASFTSAQGDAYFNNANTDYINISGLAFTNTSLSLLPGDIIYQATNSTPSTVNTSVLGTFKFYDSVRNIVYVDNSSANFSGAANFVQFHRFVNSSVMTPNTTTIIASANTTSLYNPVVDALVPQVATLSPSGTAIKWGYKGTSNSYVIDTTELSVQPGIENEFYDKERIISALSNETTQMGGAKSFQLHANLTTQSAFVSPLIDTVRHQELVIANLIDPVSFNYNEFYAYSNTKSKYVSHVVTLAPGQDAQDIQVSITGHRPPGTDITVWVKFLNGEDADPISLKTWTPLINQSYAIYSDPSNPNDFKEYNYVTAATFAVFNTSGTISANNSVANVTGVGTKFGTDVQVGWWINMAPNSTFQETPRQIISITNTTLLTLSAPFTSTVPYSGNTYYLVVPPTVAYASVNTHTQITGTVTTTTTNNAIIGSGTNFAAQFIPGNIIDCANDQQVVVSVVNSTYLTVGEPWSSAVSAANAFVVTPTGITYLNSNSALYNTYKQFQLKIVLQSNDSSKVPFMDDLRVLAMQI